MLINKIGYVFGLFRNYTNWYYIIFCRFFNRPIKKIFLRSGISIVGSNRSLAIDIVDEVFIRKVYDPPFLQIKSSDVIVDIGANIGIFSLYAASKGCRDIYSIEPLKGNLKLIKENFAANKFNLPVIINLALSDKDGLSKLYLSDFDSHSLLFNKNVGQKHTKYLNVKTFKLSSLLREYNIGKIDFLKIDCEGSEGYIFSSSEKSDWKNIKKISIEYHNGVSKLDDAMLIKKLSDFGYKTKRVRSDHFFGYIYAWK